MRALKRNPFYSLEVDEALAALDQELEGLEQSATPETSFQSLYHDVIRVANELGHPPTRAEYRKEGQYRTQVLCRRFNPVSGTWEGAMWESVTSAGGSTIWGHRWCRVGNADWIQGWNREVERLRMGMLRQGFEPWSLPREGNMIGRTTLSEPVLNAFRRSRDERLTVAFPRCRVPIPHGRGPRTTARNRGPQSGQRPRVGAHRRGEVASVSPAAVYQPDPECEHCRGGSAGELTPRRRTGSRRRRVPCPFWR